MKKAIVTGATGGLGRNLVAELLAQGWQVQAYGRNASIGKQLPTAFQAFDLSDLSQTLQHWQGADVVFHCAALSSPWGRASDFERANVQATQNVATAIKQFGADKWVHVSTPSIYFDFQDHLQIEESYLPKKWVNDYARSKYMAEQCVINSQIPSVILRPRAIFGEYDSTLLPRLLRIADKGFLPLIKRRGRKAGDALIDVTYVGNVVYALIQAANCHVPSASIFNISNDQPLTVSQLYQQIAQTLNKKFRYLPMPYVFLDQLANCLEKNSRMNKEPAMTRYSIGTIAFDHTLNIQAAKQHLHYRPIYSLAQGLTRYAQHLSTAY